MDPWSSSPNSSESSFDDSCNAIAESTESFEDNFKPTVGETLPDSKQYLETLENKLRKLRNDSDVLRQLAEKREACMQQLMQGEADYATDDENLDTAINSSAFLRAVAPERQALTTGEIVELVKYDRLNNDEDPEHSDSASR